MPGSMVIYNLESIASLYSIVRHINLMEKKEKQEEHDY
jgi:uncharacterized membrane protein YuzA (DUF378 family)